MNILIFCVIPGTLCYIELSIKYFKAGSLPLHLEEESLQLSIQNVGMYTTFACCVPHITAVITATYFLYKEIECWKILKGSCRTKIGET